MRCLASWRSSKTRHRGWKQALSGEFVSLCVSVGLLFMVMIYLLKFMLKWAQMQSGHHYMGKDKLHGCGLLDVNATSFKFYFSVVVLLGVLMHSLISMKKV